MAVLNEIVWRTQSTDVWVNFKVFGVTPLTMIFAIAQMPLTKRYGVEPVSLEASEAEAGDVRKGGVSCPGRAKREPGPTRAATDLSAWPRLCSASLKKRCAASGARGAHYVPAFNAFSSSGSSTLR